MFVTRNKQYLFIVLCALIQANLLSPLHAQTRNTIWLDGLQTTSLGFQPSRYYDLKNYDFEDLVFTEFNPNAGYNPWLGVEGAADYLYPIVEGREDVLGIAHDYGGLILRDLAIDDNDEISAMILDGVPNQGSSAIDLVMGDTDGSSSESRIQTILNEVKGIKQDEDCEDCNVIGLFENWVDEIAHPDNSSVFKDVKPGSDVVNALNANPPDIPFAIIWGSVQGVNTNQSIVTLIDSRGSITGYDTELADCVSEKLRERQKKLDDDELIKNIGLGLGLFKSVVEFAGSLISDQVFGGPNDSDFDTGGFLEALAAFADSLKDPIIDYLESDSEIDQRAASLLRCEVANQMLSVKWELAMIDAGGTEVGLVDAPTDAALPFCEDHCWEQFGGTTPDRVAWGQCIRECLQNNQAPQIAVYLTPDHDLLLTKQEQQLAGQANTYHLFNHNHFQESRDRPGDNTSDLDDAFEELFSGSVSPAFAIPQQ
jgi:hypothetical protein